MPDQDDQLWLYVGLRLRRIDATEASDPRLLDRVYLLLNDDRAVVARADVETMRTLFQRDPRICAALQPLQPRVVEGTQADLGTWIVDQAGTAEVARFSLQGGALFGVLVTQEHSGIYEDQPDLLPIVGAIDDDV